MITSTWKLYEKGKEHKRRLGLYERVRENERFYRGDQWHGVNAENLPKPVFNVIKRVIDHLVCSVASDRYEISYTDEHLPFQKEGKLAEQVRGALSVMTRNAAYRWKKCRMNDMVYSLLLDAAISGDGVAYCYWDADAKSGIYRGDIGVQTVDSVNLFVSDVNRPDIQSQDYVILSGRCSVEALKREARGYGLSEREIAKIRPDDDFDCGAGDHAMGELAGDGEEKATYLVRFFREDGHVIYEKSVSTHSRTDFSGMSSTKNRYASVCFAASSPIASSIPLLILAGERPRTVFTAARRSARWCRRRNSSTVPTRW